MVRGSSEGWLRQGDPSVDLERVEEWRWRAAVPVQGCAETRMGYRHRQSNYYEFRAKRRQDLRQHRR
jgi:hypothetical protein